MGSAGLGEGNYPDRLGVRHCHHRGRRVTKPILVEVVLACRGHTRTRVDEVWNTVSIIVGIAGVADAIIVVIEVEFRWVQWAGIFGIREAVSIVIFITGITQTVPIGINEAATKGSRAIVFFVQVTVIVIIGIASIAAVQLQIGVQLVGIEHLGTIIFKVQNAIVIVIVVARITS